VSGATDLAAARRDRSTPEIAAALRAQWRMIASVSLRPCRDGEGFRADLRFDPIVVKGSLEQQGYPRTREALIKIEGRRHAALEECVRLVNARLPAPDRIKSFSVVG
jgi:hypothetical protein